MSNVKKAALEYAIERVPESAKFKEQIIVGNHLREEIHDSFIRGFEFANEWFSISEKMPPEGETVLFKYENFDCIVGFYTISQKFMAKLFLPLGIDNIELQNVTHWRFL